MFGAHVFFVSDIKHVNEQMTAELNAMGSTSDAQQEIAKLRLLVDDLTDRLEDEQEAIQCCPHCDHEPCDSNCDFRCRKGAKRDGCNGQKCGTKACFLNHRTYFARASDLLDFESKGGKMNEVVRVGRER